jgi:hypothetical protein
MLRLNPDFLVTFTQSRLQEIAIGRLERAPRKGNLSLMMFDGIGPFGEEQTVRAGLMEQRE